MAAAPPVTAPAPGTAWPPSAQRTTRLVLLLCWLAILAEGYDIGVLGAVLPALSSEAGWNLTPIQLGALGSYTVFGMLIGGLLVGTLSDLYGRKPLFVACLSLFTVCMAATAMAPTPLIFGLFRFVAGLGLGGIIPIAAALTVEYSPPHRRSLNYGLMYSGYSLGILAAALVGRSLLPDYGWRPVVLVGALPIVIVPLMIWRLPESLDFLVEKGRTADAARLAARLGLPLPTRRAAPGETIGWRAILAEIFSRRNARATIAFWTALFMGLLLVYGLGQWLPQIMRRSGYELGDSLLFLAVFSFTSAIGGIVLGRLADRFGVRRTVFLTYLLGAAGIAALSLQGSIWMNYAFVAVAGFGSVSSSLILTGYLAQYLSPRVRAGGTGWALSFARIGAFCGPLLGGYVASLGVDTAWNFYAFALVGLIAALATAAIPARREARAG
ncbi:MFS transporter [Aureimonas ureilytica]|uniref:MFS transporter n=1 Tax=Aureimonas ureilytica TaxID=401562 RepID=UPI0003698A21|nr:MFS transporter [Aureimonas ureilytica]